MLRLTSTAIRRPLAMAAGPLSAFKPRWKPPPKDYDSQFGDYPKLPWQEWEKRDPNVKWDDPIHRRNFGEPIHEEFDVQDGYFQGEHDAWGNLLKGLYGQVVIGGILIGFFGLAWLIHNPNSKPPKKELPPEVVEYLETTGVDRIIKRPYEVPMTPMYEGGVGLDHKFPPRKTDEFGRPLAGVAHHH